MDSLDWRFGETAENGVALDLVVELVVHGQPLPVLVCVCVCVCSSADVRV